jgi:hypothetical protein
MCVCARVCDSLEMFLCDSECDQAIDLLAVINLLVFLCQYKTSEII